MLWLKLPIGCCFLSIQYAIWWGSLGLMRSQQLQGQIAELRQQIVRQTNANRAQLNRIQALADFTELEGLARRKLQMVKPGEQFFLIKPPVGSSCD